MFSPDEARILTSSEDGTAGVWEGGRLGYRARCHAVQQVLRVLGEAGAELTRQVPGDPPIEGIDDVALADPAFEAASISAFMRTSALVLERRDAKGE